MTKAWVGSMVPGKMETKEFSSLKDAESYVGDVLANSDPEGVERGDYYIDATESEMAKAFEETFPDSPRNKRRNTQMEHHPDSPLIDGTVPRSERERVGILLDYAEFLLNEEQDRRPRRDDYEKLLSLWFDLRRDYENHSDEFEFWNEIEDDLIYLCSDLLPDPWYVTINPDDSGTVVIWSHEDEEE